MDKTTRIFGKPINNQKGMTLIEVLIASIILFVAIGTVSGVHRILNHYQNLNKADYALLLSQASFFDYLSYNLEQNIYSGNYNIGKYVIAWESKLNKSAPVIKGYDPEIGLERGFSNSGSMLLHDVSYYFKQFPDRKFEVTKLVIKSDKRTAGL